MGAATGTMLPFLSPILASRGFSVEAIGLLLAIASLGIVIIVPAWGHLGDVVLGRSLALRLTALLAAAAAVLVVGPTPLVFVGIGLVCWYVLQVAFSTLLDSIFMGFLPDRRYDYGSFRLLQSISFAFVALGGGILYDRFGYGIACVLFAAAVGAMVLCLRGFRDRPHRLARGAAATAPGGEVGADRAGNRLNAEAPVAQSQRATRRLRSPSFGSLSASMRAAPTLPHVLSVIVLASFAVLSTNTFLPLRLYELGATPSVLAASATISALCEVPIMLMGARLASRLGLRGFFALGCLLYAVALASWTVVDEPLVIVASRVATGLAYGSFTVASVLAVATVLPDSLQASGQGLRGSAVSVLAVLGYLFGGLVYGLLGHSAFFFLGAVSAVIAALMAWRWLPTRGAARLGPSLGQLEHAAG